MTRHTEENKPIDVSQYQDNDEDDYDLQQATDEERRHRRPFLQRASIVILTAFAVFLFIQSAINISTRSRRRLLYQDWKEVGSQTRIRRKLWLEQYTYPATTPTYTYDTTPKYAYDTTPQVAQSEYTSPATTQKYTYDTTPQSESSRIQLPNLLYVGAQKTGSTGIAFWLFLVNGVCSAEVFDGEPHFYKKEVHFFNDPGRFKNGVDFYARRFQHCPADQVSMDATPNYLNYAQEIHDFYLNAYGSSRLKTDLKILISLREPIARELSLYNMKLSFWKGDPNPKAWYGDIARYDGSAMHFDEYADRVIIPELKDPETPNYSKYAFFLRQWFSLFDRNNIQILSYEELQLNSNMTQWRIKEFLGHDEFGGEFPHKNQQKFSGKVTDVSCETQAKLQKVLAPMNQDFYDLLKEHQGPPMEIHPFPHFFLEDCAY